MLVLTRKPEETIHIGDDVVLRVIKVKGNKVQLGIEAPKNIAVIRSELLEKDKQAAKELAAQESAVVSERNPGQPKMKFELTDQSTDMIHAIDLKKTNGPGGLNLVVAS